MYSASSKAVSIFSLAAANLLQAKQSRRINFHVDNNILAAVKSELINMAGAWNKEKI